MASKLQATTVMRGAFWATLTLYLGKVVGFFATLILAAILPAVDFGVYALVFLIYNAMLLLADLGLRHALIYFEGDRKRLVDTVFTFLVAIDITLYIALFFGAPLLADYFGEPQLTELLRVIGIGVIFSAYSATCAALLEKDLDFKRKLLPELLPRVVQLFVCVGVALAGGGVWSFIAGHVAQAVLEATGYAIVSPRRPGFAWATREAKQLIGYAGPIIVSSILLFVFTNLDDAIIGKVLGTSVLGFYYFAYRLSNFPATNISWLAGRIAFPSYSMLKDDIVGLRKAFVTTTRLVSLLVFPASAIILIFAPPALALVYGEKWGPSVPVMMILVAFGLLRALFGYYGSVFFALGRPARILPMVIVWIVLGFVPIVPVAERWGVEGISVLLTLAVAVGGLLRLPGLLSSIDLKLREYLQVMLLPISASLVAGVAAKAVLLATDEAPGWLMMLAGAIVFSAIYLAAMARFAPDIKNLLTLAKTTVGK
jgi:O-antigen/teichoic acid export membrane protein